MDEKILSKVKAMLSKADPSANATPEEAQSAILKAQEFMAKHGISQVDIDAITGIAKKDKKVEKEAAIQVASLQQWERDLAMIIGENFRCEHYWNRWRGRGSKTTLLFLGLDEDVALAKEVYVWARESIKYYARSYRKAAKKEVLKNLGIADMTLDEIEKAAYEAGLGFEAYELREKFSRTNPLYRTHLVAELRKTQMNAVGIRNDFIEGFLSGLRAKFRDQVDKNGWGLVLVKDALVTKTFADMKIRTVSRHEGQARSFDAEAYREGYKTGKSLEKAAGHIKGAK